MNYGTAKSDGPIAIAYSKGLGSLWYNQRVAYYPRFELNLQVTINPYGGSTGQAIEGFSIMFTSNTNQYMAGDGPQMGYWGITNAFVVEVDLNYNPEFSDSYSTSVSLHTCFDGNSCNSYENSNTIQKNIPNVIKINFSVTHLI